MFTLGVPVLLMVGGASTYLNRIVLSNEVYRGVSRFRPADIKVYTVHSYTNGQCRAYIASIGISATVWEGIRYEGHFDSISDIANASRQRRDQGATATGLSF